MKSILFILLIVFVNLAFTQDYFVKKYPVDYISGSSGMDFDSDSNIVINYGQLISLDKKGKVNWAHFTSVKGKVTTHPLGFCTAEGEIDLYNVNGDTIKRRRRTYGGDVDIYDVNTFNNGDLLLTTWSNIDFPTPKNMYFTVARLNSNLDLIWTKNIGDTTSMQGNVLCATSGDYSYIVGSSKGKVSIILLDELGNLVWEKQLDVLNPIVSNSNNNISDILVYKGDLYIAGTSLPKRSFIIKISNSGQLEFVKYIKISNRISLSNSSNSLLAYYSYIDIYSQSRRGQLINFDTNGNVLFAKYVDVESSPYLSGVLFDNDTIIYTYFTENYPPNSLDYILLTRTHVSEVVNCYEVENTDSISFLDANYVVLPQSFTVQNASTYEKNLSNYIGTPTNVQDTTLCETFLPPKPPIEGDVILTVYPNPSNGAFQFQLTNLALEEGELIKLVVYEMNGKLVQQSVFSTKTFTINTESTLALGMYVCKLTVKGQKLIKKLVIE